MTLEENPVTTTDRPEADYSIAEGDIVRLRLLPDVVGRVTARRPRRVDIHAVGWRYLEEVERVERAAPAFVRPTGAEWAPAPDGTPRWQIKYGDFWLDVLSGEYDELVRLRSQGNMTVRAVGDNGIRPNPSYTPPPEPAAVNVDEWIADIRRCAATDDALGTTWRLESVVREVLRSLLPVDSPAPKEPT